MISRQGLYAFKRRWQSGKELRRTRKICDSAVKLKKIHLKFMDMWLAKNNELTTEMLKRKLFEVFGLNVSTSLIRKRRSELGWKTVVSKTCQLISKKNKLVRQSWCLEALNNKEDFRNVIFVDESTVEMSSSGQLFFHQPESKIQKICARRPKPKHAYKVHVWAGISYRGRTNICIFNGVMDSVVYQDILDRNFIPFVEERFPDGYRLYQDNDSKHKSKSTRDRMTEKGILNNVMTTPASSPDLNPIENVWASIKYYLQIVAKPRTKDQRIQGIKEFWETLSTPQCVRYIDHIHKVIPYVVLNRGEASGY